MKLIQVNYAPKVVVVVEEGALDTGRIPEGNTVKFWCNADANPNDMSYRWFMNDEVIANATLNQLVSNKIFEFKFVYLSNDFNYVHILVLVIIEIVLVS